MNIEQREECAKLVLDRLLDVYGELHAVTMTIHHKDRNKLMKVTKAIDKASKLVLSQTAENEHEKELCRQLSVVLKILLKLKKRISNIIEREYVAPKDIESRHQREQLATPSFNTLQELSREVFNIIESTDSSKIKAIFENVLSNVDTAISDLSTFVCSNPIDEALREDLYAELKTLINETHSVKILLQETNEEQKP